MMEDDENIKMSITELTVHKRSTPFAQGAMRVAAYARTKNSTNRFVVKSFKKHGKKLAHLAEDMRCQALCKAFALEFSALVGEESSLDFITTTCLRAQRRGGARDEHLSLEPLISGSYVKYSNNTSWVNRDNPDDPINQAAQAFSHFTFERSQGRFLVNDIQGVGRLLTDPAIHTRDEDRFKLSDTNLGREGFKFFFSSHECNEICRKLKLQSDRAMLVAGIYAFRDDWPSMDNVVCCSNKLCGKILQLASSKTSHEYEGHHWCATCFPQLKSTNMDLLCLASGPQHEFKVSRFFYESQGRQPPRLCAAHRRDDNTLFKPEFNASTAVITNAYRTMPGAFTDGVEEDAIKAIIESPSSTESGAEAVATPPESPRETAIEVTDKIPTPSPDMTAVPYSTGVFTPTNPHTRWERPERFNWPSVTESSPENTVTVSLVAATLPYTPYSATTVAKTKKRNEQNPAAASRLSLAGNGGFWSKLKKRSLSFKPSVARLGKKE